ncbi:hypothetical protein [Streptomyces sp. NPDC014685]|uniref:hypothetical protein n=1 Tax=Streptomyces sp. NPDC014685 TaxID=3364881 RepID=UPI0036FBBDA8
MAESRPVDAGSSAASAREVLEEREGLEGWSTATGEADAVASPTVAQAPTTNVAAGLARSAVMCLKEVALRLFRHGGGGTGHARGLD